jgi:hypothetical protein
MPLSIDVMPGLEEGFQALTMVQAKSSNIGQHSPQTSSPEQDLCEVCRLINLKEFFCGENQEPFLMHIGLVKDILLKKMKCSMCYLIVKALEQSWTDIPIITQTGGIGSLQRGEVFYVSWRAGQPLITSQLHDSMGSIQWNEVVLRRCEGTTTEVGLGVISIHIFCEGEEVKRGTSWIGVGGGIIGEEKFPPEYVKLSSLNLLIRSFRFSWFIKP